MSHAPSPSPPSGVSATLADIVAAAFAAPAVAPPDAGPPGVLALPTGAPPAGAADPSPAPSARRSPPTIGDVLRDRKHRIGGWTPVKVAAFIHVLGDTGSVTKAAAYVRMTPASAYALRNRPGGEPFAEAWETAIGARHEMLAEIAFDRVRDGVERTRWWQGQVVGVDRVFSDRLLIHMLSLTSPERRSRPAPAPLSADEAAAAAMLLETSAGDEEEDRLDHDATVSGDTATDDGSVSTSVSTGGAGDGGYSWADGPPGELPWQPEENYSVIPDDIAALMAASEAAYRERRAEWDAGIADIDARLDEALGRGGRK